MKILKRKESADGNEQNDDDDFEEMDEDSNTARGNQVLRIFVIDCAETTLRHAKMFSR
jgi:hypothetical protein